MRPDEIIAWASGGPTAAAAAKARLILLDSLGCALAGLGHPRVAAFARAMEGAFPGGVQLAGAALAPGAAAAVLATATCWDEANEGLARAHGRPALPVAPMALVARACGADPGAALGAFALGYEVAARAGEAWRIRPGMHVDGSWHSLGAASCAARLMGLDAGGVARAVRLAACQLPFALYAPIAAGMDGRIRPGMHVDGSWHSLGAASCAAQLMGLDAGGVVRAVRLAACQLPFALYAPIAAGMDGRNSYPAHAALLGHLAGAAAAAGMDAPAGGFEEARRIALGHDGPSVVTPPGHWLIEEAYLKPFAGVRHAHYAAAAALSLRGRVGPDPQRITLATYAEALRYAGNRDPRAAIAAQFSLSWAVAAALVQGDLGPAAYSDAALADPQLRAIESRIELVEDLALTAGGLRGATLTVDGEAATVTRVTGDPDQPMSEAEALAKFRRFATPRLGEAGAQRAIAAIMHDAPAEGLFG